MQLHLLLLFLLGLLASSGAVEEQKPQQAAGNVKVAAAAAAVKPTWGSGRLQVELTTAGEAVWLNVSWSGVTCPLNIANKLCDAGAADSGDRIAVSHAPPAPGGSDNKRHPIKFLFVSQAAPGSWRQGRGSCRFWLPALPAPVRVAYVRKSMNPLIVGLWRDYAEVAGADVQPPASQLNMPALGRLSVAGSSPSSMAVTWHTATRTESAAVQWGTDASALSSSAAASFSQGYSSAAMCGEPARYQGWWGGTDAASSIVINSAVMQPLLPLTRYHYRYGSNEGGWSRVHNFTTPPAPGMSSDDAPLRVLLAADMGHWAPDAAHDADGNLFEMLKQLPSSLSVPNAGSIPFTIVQSAIRMLGGLSPQPGAQAVMAGLAAELASAAGRPYHGLLLNGDVSYARGESAQWLAWLHQMQDVLRSVPALYASGNHEADGQGLADAAPFAKGVDGGGECGVAYRELLRMPQPSGRQADWYSYAAGPVFFLVFSSEQDFTRGSRMYTWMASALAAVDRAATPWLVVAAHRPMYADTPDDGDVAVAELMLQHLEPLFAAAQVDLVLAGHVHTYSRSCPVLKGTCVGSANGSARGPVHLLFGNGGFQMPMLAYSKAPAWLASSHRGFGFSTLEATRTSMRIRSLTASGAEVDAATLTKPAGWAPNAAAAAALYAATRATPPPTPPVKLAHLGGQLVLSLAGQLTEQLKRSGGNISSDAFLAVNFGPGSAAYNLTNARPGEGGVVWSPHQVWAAAYPLVQALAAAWMQAPPLAGLARELAYVHDLLRPGGRLWFGGGDGG